MATVALLATACGPVGWPMFRFGPDHTGSSSDTSINQSAVSSSMVLAWTGATANAVSSTPAVANGSVYVGSTDGRLYAWDAAGNTNCSGSPTTCAPLWSGATGGGITSSPAVSNGVVYVGSSDHSLYAFDAAGNTNCGGTPRTCAPLWSATTGGPIGSSPAVANGVVYVGSSDDSLYAFDAAGNTNCGGTPRTCAPLWSATTGGPIGSSPAVANGVVYVGSGDGNVYAFDAAGSRNCAGSPMVCAPLWSATTGGSVTSSPAVANATVYVGSADGKLYAFDAAGSRNCTGSPARCSPLWTAGTGGAVGSSPAVANGALYVGSADGRLYAFDAAGVTNCSGSPTTCTPLWSAPTGGAIVSSPGVANGVVYVGSSDDDVYAFDAGGAAGCAGTPKVCAPLWKAATGGAVLSSPVIVNRYVYAGSGDGKLYAFGLENVPPTTSITQPAPGATLSGTVTLQATASDDVSVSRVEFHLTGGGYTDALIAVGTQSGSVWTSTWDTTPVPNGSYTITSVAYDPAGNVGRSAGVGITVQYQGCGNPHPGLAPCDLRNAYELPSTTAGNGQTVAVVDAFDDPNAEADLGVYRSAYGLGACTTANGCFRKVNQSGVAGSYPAGNTSWAEEMALDLDMVSAVCPNCHILLVEATTNSTLNLAAAENTAARLGATEISNSWGGNESSSETSTDSSFNHPGIAITASSGDGGYAAGTQYPAASPFVTGVGGTNLTAASSTARGWTETAWSSAGSGCSAYETKPSWQQDSGCAKRTVADVAAIAGSPGVAVYDSYNTSGWIRLGGTSVASPIVASVYALATPLAGESFTYGHTGSLFDVTSGSNGTCGGSYLCTAGTGYDGPTGLGTPCGTGAFGTAATPAACGVSPSTASPATSAPSVPVPRFLYQSHCAVQPPGFARCDHGLLVPETTP